MSIKELWDKLDGKKYEGSALNTGKAYHDVPFMQGDYPSHRKNSMARVEKILSKIDVKGKFVLDLGCSVGGISLPLAIGGATVLGIDYDPSAIEVANEIATEFKLDAIYVVNDVCDLKPHMDKMKKVDICVWFSQFMWLMKQYGKEKSFGILKYMSDKCKEMFFETAISDTMAGSAMTNAGITNQDAVKMMLRRHTNYEFIDDLGDANDGWYKRNVFHCHN